MKFVIKDTAPLLFICRAGTGDLIGTNEYIEYYDEQWKKPPVIDEFFPIENFPYSIDIKTLIVDLDMIEYLKENSFDLYIRFIGEEPFTKKIQEHFYKFENCQLTYTTYCISEERKGEFIANILAKNKVEVFKKELPKEILQEMDKNE